MLIVSTKGLGSSSYFTEAVLVMVPVSLGLTTRWTVVEVLALSVPRLQVIVPPASLQPEVDINSELAGNLLVSFRFVAGALPVFVILIW